MSGTLIKIHGGTRSGDNLCLTCHQGQVIKGDAESDIRVYCHQIEKFVGRKIVECSKFDDRNKPSIADMYGTAWILETSKNKRTVGFTPWKDYSKKHGDHEKYGHD